MPLTNEMKRESEEQRLLKLQPCKLCRELKKTAKCPGHGLGNEGDDGDEAQLDPQKSDEKSKITASKKPHILRPHQNPLLKKTFKSIPNENTPDDDLRSTLSQQQNIQLIVRHIHVVRDREYSTLTLFFEKDPAMSAAKRERIESTLNTVWNEFIRLYPKHGCRLKLEKDAQGNITSLNATVPNEHFQQFIDMLTTHGLLNPNDAFRIHQAMKNTFVTPRNPLDLKLIR